MRIKQCWMRWLYRITLGSVVGVMAGSVGANPPVATPAGYQQPVPLNTAIQRKYPEQIVLVTSVGEDGGPANIMTAGWTMFCSGNPPSVAVSIGKTRFSHGLIEQTRQFVLAFPGADLEEEMLFCGTKSGRDVDKFEATRLTARTAAKVKPPLIDEAIVNLECDVTHAVDVGSHTIFVGRIVHAWEHRDAGGMQRLYTLGGGKFGAWPGAVAGDDD